eukprot:scaffold23834_cov132-Cylindrotheca_fusiformis.AAC.7
MDLSSCCVKVEVPADDFAGWQQDLEMAGLLDLFRMYDRLRRLYVLEAVVRTISHATPKIVSAFSSASRRDWISTNK